MNIRKLHLSRRTVLRGAGATIALPLLDAMIPAGTALAQTAAAPVQRVGFVYVPHGAVDAKWRPAAEGADFPFSHILQPLEPYRSHVTVVSGCRNKPGESPDPHGIKAGTWLRCVAPDGNGNPEDGVSTDQIAAAALGGSTPFPSLELSTAAGGTNNGSFASTIAFRTPSQPLPMEANPRKLFYRLFGQGDTAEEREAIVAETGSLLDLVAEDATALRARLGASDKMAMENYLDSVREIESQIQKLQEQDLSDLAIPEAPVGIPANFEQHLDMMYGLWALALQADLTRVVTFMTDREVSMRTFTNIGVSDAFHPLSHHQDDPAKLERLANVQQWFMSVFARFIGKLAETQDGEGTLLDHSLILYGSGMANSNLHNNDPIPSVLLGKAAGKVKGNQHLVYPQDTPLGNLMLTVLDRVGVERDHHGDSTGMFAEV
jgi:hypothetical protein